MSRLLEMGFSRQGACPCRCYGHHAGNSPALMGFIVLTLVNPLSRGILIPALLGMAALISVVCARDT